MISRSSNRDRFPSPSYDFASGVHIGRPVVPTRRDTMRRTAISQWELSDRFWAESDPPEPRAVVAETFFQKCARQLDRLTADKRVKYRLTATGTDRGNDRVKSLSPPPPPPPSAPRRFVIERAAATAPRERARTFENVPNREVSTRRFGNGYVRFSNFRTRGKNRFRPCGFRQLDETFSFCGCYLTDNYE